MLYLSTDHSTLVQKPLPEITLVPVVIPLYSPKGEAMVKGHLVHKESIWCNQICASPSNFACICLDIAMIFPYK